jgi:branched-chain amino acid transport system substrate-binding protein
MKRPNRFHIDLRLFAALVMTCGLAPWNAWAEPVRIPIAVPTTGPLALEGTSQRNGALLAIEEAATSLELATEEADTAASAETALNALSRVLSRPRVVAVAASIFGPQMLAMMPVAEQAKVPLLTVSGTARLTEMGNAHVFRFFPADPVVKAAQARYAVEELKKTKAAILYQTTAYGQSGREALMENLAKLGATVVHEESLALAIKDFSAALAKAKSAGADVLLLQLHSGPTALVVKQAAAQRLGLPIVAGSAMHQPSTAALLEPSELAGVCAESGSSPLSGGSPEMDRFTAAYRKRFGADPDGFALAQYDAVRMAIEAIAKGARTSEAVRAHLAAQSHAGLAMTYRSDGKGNMAHDAVIVCYDGQSRIPRLTKRYAGAPRS